MQFNKDASRLNYIQWRGHFQRKGHELTGYYTSGEFPALIRTCC